MSQPHVPQTTVSQKTEIYGRWVVSVIVALLAFGQSYLASHQSNQVSAELEKMREQLSKPQVKIMWPLRHQPVRPCEYLVGWARGIPADEHLFVVLSTGESKKQRTYKYPVDIDPAEETWKTMEPVEMTTPSVNYTLYLYRLKENERVVSIGDSGPPSGWLAELDVKRSTEEIIRPKRPNESDCDPKNWRLPPTR